MKRLILAITLIALAATLSSCASYFKRKECEKTNWYKHGQDVAKKGHRLDVDKFVKTCEKVEADIDHQALDLGFKKGMATYCEKKFVYALGKTGKAFNKDMCDGPNQRRLVERYNKGIRIYCQPRNGYKVGAKGEVYENICPEDLEPKFMTQYERGRKVYLSDMIDEKSQEVTSLEGKISSAELQRSQLNRRISRVKVRKIPVVERVYDDKKKKYVNRATIQDDPAALKRINNLRSDLNRVDRQIRDHRKSQETLKAEISQHKRELAALQ